MPSFQIRPSFAALSLAMLLAVPPIARVDATAVPFQAESKGTAPSSGGTAKPDASPEARKSDVRIERILPTDTILVAAIDRWSDFEARVRRTPLWGLWESKEVQDALGKAAKMQAQGEAADTTLDEALAEIGLDREKLVAPEGTVGVGLFLEMNEELGQKQPQMLAVAEYGASADKAQEMFDSIFGALAKKDIKIEERDLRGRSVKSLQIPEAEAEEDEDEFDDFGAMPDPSELFKGMRTIHFCRDGDRYLVSSSLVALEDALEVLDGKKPGATLEGNDDYQRALRQLGDARQAWAVLLTAPIQPLLGQVGGGMAAMVTPVLGKLVGDIRAYSFGLGVDGKDGMAESRIGILSPAGKVGLLSLLESRPRGAVPPHVGPDAVSYGRMNIRFRGIMPLVNDVVKNIPAPFGDQIEMQLEQFGPTLEKSFSELGPEMHVSTTLAQPLTAESKQQSVAIRSPNPDSFRPLLDLFAPMGGLAPQDFLGNTIWADEFSPMAFGLGGGWVVIGDQRSVEGVLRAAGQKDLASLAEDKGFRRAFSIIPDQELVGWGWQNVVAEYRFSKIEFQAQMEELKQILGDDAAAEFEPDGLAGILQAISPELLEKHIGPSVWWMQSSDDGFVYATVLLAPE